MLTRLREHLPASILAVMIVGFVTLGGINLLPGLSDADGFSCPENIMSTAIAEGDFTPTERTAVVVREVDFRSAAPGVFYYVQWVESNQTLKVGKDVNGPQQNRDAWTVGDDIQNASCVAAKLALDDANGNIANSVVWLQVECPREEVLQAARDAGLTVKDWNDDPNVENWFIQVTAEVDSQFVLVCDASQPAATVPPTTAAPATTNPPATTPTTVAAPATTNPPATTPTTVPRPTTTTTVVTPNCDVVYDVKLGQTVPKGTLVLLERVDFSRRTITLEVKTLEADTPESVKGALHTNLWYGYCSEASAREGLESQFAERVSEAAIPGSWAYDFTVTRK
jgi:biotin carboxyl carrier protein